MATRNLRILLIVNEEKPDARQLMELIRDELSSEGCEICVCGFSGTPEQHPEGRFDLAISLGGDGTVLYAARCLAKRGIPIMPVHMGTLGFIAAVQQNEWKKIFDQWKAKTAKISARLMLRVDVLRDGVEVFSYVCLNDAVITAAGISKIIRLDVGTLDLHFGHYRADGLIVASPTGCTAYSVAAGGPILDPEMEAMIVNPICPFTLSNRAIVIPSHETIRVLVEQEQRSDVLLTVDGQDVFPLQSEDCVHIRQAEAKALLVASGRDVFFKVLRTKLNWSGGPDA
jgi:NAD+ kinase